MGPSVITEAQGEQMSTIQEGTEKPSRIVSGANTVTLKSLVNSREDLP